MQTLMKQAKIGNQTFMMKAISLLSKKNKEMMEMATLKSVNL